MASTIGIDFINVKRKVSEKTIRVQLWDSAGQEKYRCIASAHYKSINILNQIAIFLSSSMI